MINDIKKGKWQEKIFKVCYFEQGNLSPLADRSSMVIDAKTIEYALLDGCAFLDEDGLKVTEIVKPEGSSPVPGGGRQQVWIDGVPDNGDREPW